MKHTALVSLFLTFGIAALADDVSRKEIADIATREPAAPRAPLGPQPRASEFDEDGQLMPPAPAPAEPSIDFDSGSSDGSSDYSSD